MHLILVTEIWGKTRYVDALAAELERMVSGISVVDPYDGVAIDFSCEEAAYDHYLKACGHKAYAAKLAQEVSKIDSPTLLIGFSAGATAVWSVVCESCFVAVNRAICFYGSGIRLMQDRNPEVNTDLIFPNHEPHYNVDEIIDNLQCINLVECHKADYGHGFMNQLSVNYNEKAYQQWTHWIKNKISLLLTDCHR
ncbi:hypothetical protein [Maridesulfovibrio bastinii]|uniref:hypothetical protein n=1 Tax=Maridesulfovibrio bastinii TaxID=47157 RepID=UPI00040BB567|nr:hypothetical protein [Maridesulfovibrio bastinii]